ncbi:MAG: protease inhibitor I42 family protein [SAR202 cluster bacterium]|jgi:predicted secreted protein|nr:protease inhibitor I42 family protein [SAR202 cluster bacterium]MDP6665150.1 protease inhibitor I42 family protein [SAR202 cluster bacterium]MDP6801039.1 protease inhibitor I42 family protein [SAR202 cluster bacterium]|tara:strand:+ start:1256 stop:1708 length:453 start_codon:yes stop_codon:yes gene_type:complete
MKHHSLASTVVVLIVASLLAAAACSDSGDDSSEPSVEVSCDDFATLDAGFAVVKEMTVDADTLMAVTLCSNITTGHSWELADISDASVLEHVDSQYVSPEGANIPGAAGKETWTFRAIGKGASTVSMEYSQPWEGGTKRSWAFDLVVAVR